MLCCKKIKIKIVINIRKLSDDSKVEKCDKQININ